jgi:hypothetical protein
MRDAHHSSSLASGEEIPAFVNKETVKLPTEEIEETVKLRVFTCEITTWLPIF